MQELFLYLFAAWLGVSNMVLWGVYGDVLVEKFDLHKVWRSFSLATIAAIAIYFYDSSLNLFLVALSAISLERAITEIYKALICNEDQEKYQIPSDLNLKLNTKIKWSLAAVLIASLLIFASTFTFQINYYLLILFAGLITALGGMGKDAPYEGFEPLKFWRSPFLALLGGVPILLVVDNPDHKIFLLSVFGLERIFSEFYKKFIRIKFLASLNIKYYLNGCVNIS